MKATSFFRFNHLIFQYFILFWPFFLLVFTAHAQQIILKDLNGRPIFENSYLSVEGTPYLREEWSAGLIKAKSNGKTYEMPKMRYDAHKDEIEYDQVGKLFRFTSAEINEFSTGEGTFRAGFPAVGNLTPKNFYQVLYDGRVKLLKRVYLAIQTERLYNSATTTQRFVREDALYLFKNDGEMLKFKKDKSALLDAIGTEKQADLEAFIKQNKLKLTKEEDLVRILEKFSE